MHSILSHVLSSLFVLFSAIFCMYSSCKSNTLMDEFHYILKCEWTVHGYANCIKEEKLFLIQKVITKWIHNIEHILYLLENTSSS